MTITSGLPGTGKTQLAINIALELVRRGRQAGVFYARESATPIENLLRVQQPVNMLRRADDPRERGLLRSGYQGVDIISCGTPLREWPTIEADQRARCIQEMDVQDGYDDFLIDTSGMDARTLLACCKASGIVILLVTPEPQSHAEAFALIRVLQLNGFTGLFRIIVNKVNYPDDAEAIHDELFHQVTACLGLDVPLLGVLTQDECLKKAERVRQAFTSIFPQSAAAVGIIDIVDALDQIPVQFFTGPRTLAALWHALVDIIQLPVTLSGDELLDDGLETAQAPEPPYEEPVAGQDNETGLLQFEGNLESLCALRERLQGNLQVLFADLNAFAETAGRDVRMLTDVNDGLLQREQMINLVARVLGIIEAADPDQSFRFQVFDTVVTHPDAAWLERGRYLKYVFHILQSELPENAQTLLLNAPAMTVTAGTDGESIYEMIDTLHHCCLSIISDTQEGVRMQVWLKSEAQQDLKIQSQAERRAPAG
ncbi:MAG: hypothetical protein WBP44_03700 [Gammaproteobacteria bacterium]|jgi:flagellar biosynthesis protein FlhG